MELKAWRGDDYSVERVIFLLFAFETQVDDEDAFALALGRARARALVGSLFAPSHNHSQHLCPPEELLNFVKTLRAFPHQGYR